MPRQAFLFFTGPRSQGSVDPRTGPNGLNLRQRGALGQEFRGRGGDDGGVVGEAPVPLSHERSSVVMVLEFRHEHPIFAIEGNGDEVF